MLTQLTNKKHQLDKLRPLPPALVANLYDWLKIELTYASNAIEGNTLTRSETAQVVEKGLTVGGKSLREHLEATNHAKALDWVVAKAQTPGVAEADILKIHELVLAGIAPAGSIAGTYRSVPVRISGSSVVLPNPLKVPELMTAFIKELSAATALHPVDLAAKAHYDLVTIHPFVDGNGRTARLLMNLVLIHHGYPIAVIPVTDRQAYIDSLEQAQLGGSLTAFHQIIYRAVDASLDEYLSAARNVISP